MTNTEQRTIFGHPVGLYVLFFTEMWERFSYYGMRALLVLYMVDFFKWTQEDASGIYKWYTSLVYLTPLMGGFLADRYLGNKAAIIIGAIMMSFGHFLMASEDIWVFYAALGFLIMGNGFFKPNMSVQVGRLYAQNDPRRDGAYTIFYMGINLGAFLSPFVCGTLRETPGLGYHWGFAAAGVGMVLGLLVYLFGQRWVKELPEDAVYHDPDAGTAGSKETETDHVMTEKEAETAPSVWPSFSKQSPNVFRLLAVVLLVGSPLLLLVKAISFDNFMACEIASVSLFFASWILSKLTMASRDRVLAVYLLFVFVVFFWGAFEQAGNAMNVWADQTTNRFLSGEAPDPSLYPTVYVDVTEKGFWTVFKEAVGKLVAINPVLTTSFQSINAAAIVFFAPMFAWLWLFLAKNRIRLSIAGKMSIGVFLQGMAFALMFWAALYENGTSQTQYASLPDRIVTDNDGAVSFYDTPELGDEEAYKTYEQGLAPAESMIAQGGRLQFDSVGGSLSMRGVLNANHRDRMLRATAPKAFVKSVWNIAERSKSAEAEAKANGVEDFTFEAILENLPAGFEPKFLQGYDPKKLRFDESSGKLILGMALADKDYKQVLLAGSDPGFRTAINDLYLDSSKFRVSSWWLFWFYILCTLGELCLSPVGLSMVSKLAPRRFATMLMGVWLLTSFFGNFTAGLAGEKWEYLEPGTYFMYITLVLFGASFVCFLVVKKVTAMMHGVR